MAVDKENKCIMLSEINVLKVQQERNVGSISSLQKDVALMQRDLDFTKSTIKDITGSYSQLASSIKEIADSVVSLNQSFAVFQAKIDSKIGVISYVGFAIIGLLTTIIGAVIIFYIKEFFGVIHV